MEGNSFVLRGFFCIFAQIQNDTMTNNEAQASLPSWHDKISCQRVNHFVRLDTSKVRTSANSYVYALFEKGKAKIKFNKNEIDIYPGDLLIFPPHITPCISWSSDDYQAICLIVSNAFVYGCPLSRNVFQSATFSLIHDTDPIIRLNRYEKEKFRLTMTMILYHAKYHHSYTLEALYSLYGLFLADLLSAINKTKSEQYNKHYYQIFIDFNKLLRTHFREHHDISFYADNLKISSRYLALVTKQIAHTTVSTYINRLLMLEACWLLKNTDYSIQNISDILHFSDQASFSKFFKRLNGSNPLSYRREHEML